MPRDAGQYDTRLQRLTCAKAADAMGDRVADYLPDEWYWCKVEYTGSEVREDFNSEQTAVTATVYVHGFPLLAAVDRFQGDDGKHWHIVSIYPGDDEWVCDCFQYDTLQD